MSVIHDQFRDYRATLQDDRRNLLEHFQIVDMARKVVGVGSVGTRCTSFCSRAATRRTRSSSRSRRHGLGAGGPPAPKSRYRQHGERVVQGQQMMQAASDIYLGWTGPRAGSRPTPTGASCAT